MRRLGRVAGQVTGALVGYGVGAVSREPLVGVLAGAAFSQVGAEMLDAREEQWRGQSQTPSGTSEACDQVRPAPQALWAARPRRGALRPVGSSPHGQRNSPRPRRFLDGGPPVRVVVRRGWWFPPRRIGRVVPVGDS